MGLGYIKASNSAAQSIHSGIHNEVIHLRVLRLKLTVVKSWCLT